jgi:hypothetical protein
MSESRPPDDTPPTLEADLEKMLSEWAEFASEIRPAGTPVSEAHVTRYVQCSLDVQRILASHRPAPVAPDDTPPDQEGEIMSQKHDAEQWTGEFDSGLPDASPPVQNGWLDSPDLRALCEAHLLSDDPLVRRLAEALDITLSELHQTRYGKPAPVAPDDTPTPEQWRNAALLKDRTRRAIRERQAAGDAHHALADDYGVPLEFVLALCAWQLGGDWRNCE